MQVKERDPTAAQARSGASLRARRSSPTPRGVPRSLGAHPTRYTDLAAVRVLCRAGVSLGQTCIFAPRASLREDSSDGKRRNDPIPCSKPIGRVALELVALADRRCARGHMDSRWIRGHISWSLGRSSNTSRDAWIERRASWGKRDMLPGGRCARRTPIRLWNRPVWAQEIVLHHSCCLPRRNSAIGFRLEFLELRNVSRNHRSWHWRRIRGYQFGD